MKPQHSYMDTLICDTRGA